MAPQAPGSSEGEDAPVGRTRWGALFGRALILLAAALAIALIVAGAWLQGSDGSVWLRSKLLPLIDAQIAGGVEVGRIAVTLPGTVELFDVTLTTPEGERVLHVARARATLSLGALLGKSITLSGVEFEDPSLELVRDARGINLMRAIETEPDETPPESGGSDLAIRVRDLTLIGGRIAVRWTGDEENAVTQEALLEALSLRGRATYDLGREWLEAVLALDADGKSPLEGPLALKLDAAGTLDALKGKVALAAPGLVLDAAAGMTAPRTWSADLKKLELAPQTAKLVVEKWPLVVPLSIAGTASETNGRLTLDVRADAASAHAELEGAVDLRHWHALPLELRVTGVRLDELLGEQHLPGARSAQPVTRSWARRGASTPLSATLRVEGGGLSLESAEGTVALDMPVARFEGQRVGPVKLAARASNGVATIDTLALSLPGARATAKGTVSREKLGLSGEVHATALAELLRLLRLDLPLQATGRVDFQVDGPLTHPGISVDGTLATLDYEGNRAEDLTIVAKLPDLHHIFDLEAHLQAARVTAAGQTFEQVRLDASRTGRELTAWLQTSGEEPLSLALRGTADDARQRLTIASLTLGVGDTTWQSEGTSRLSLAQGVSWQGLALRAGAQRIALDASLVEGRVDAATKLEGVALDELPRLLVPASLGLEGSLSGRASVKGPLTKPALDVELSLGAGGAKHVRGVDASLRAKTRSSRLEGAVRVALPAAAADLTFALPYAGFALPERGPIEAELRLDRASVPGLLALAQREEQATGRLRGSIQLSGTMEATELTGSLRGEDLTFAHPQTAGLKPLAATLTLAPRGPRATEVHLEVEGLANAVRVNLRAPTGLTELMQETPNADALLARAWQLTGEVRDLPLSLLPSLGLATASSGAASLTVDVNGPLARMQGQLRLALKQAALEGRPPMDGHVEVLSTGDETTLEVRLTRNGRPLLDATAALPHSAGAIVSGRLTSQTPLKATAELYATPIAYLTSLAAGGDEGAGPAGTWVPPPGTQTLRNPVFPEAGARRGGAQARGSRSIDGNLKGVLRIEGTAGAPVAGASLIVTDLGQRGTAFGQGRGTWSYGSKKHQAALTLNGPTGGILRAEGSATMDLSLPALRRGLEPSKARISASLFAERFTLAFLSRLVPNVRELGGQLDGRLRAEGVAAAPNVSGELAWTEGLLALEGYGEYRDGRVKIRGDQNKVRIEDFHLASSGGRIQAAGALERGEGVYRIKLGASLKDFPIVYDDQLFAVATAETVTLEGRISPDALDLSRVQVPAATFELPEVKRKDLQELERPDDVVLVRDGVAISRIWRRRLLSSRRAAAEAEAQKNGADGSAPSHARDEGFRFGLSLEAPRNLWVKGSDLNLELGLSDRFRVEYANSRPLITGEVRVLRGRLAVLSRQFDVQRDSLVRFTGPATQPFVSAAATWNNEAEQVEVTMSVRGLLSDLTIKATSEPPLPETSIYTLLATGRRELGGGANGAGGGGTGAQAASVVGGLVAGQLKRTLADQLPLDVLNLEVGGSEGLSQARLEVGRYLGDKLYVGYTQRFGAVSSVRENTGTVRLEYQISPRFSLRGEFGDARQGGLDLLWSNEY